MEIDRDMEIALDARKAIEVRVETPTHETRANLGAARELAVHRTAADGPGFTDSIVQSPGDLAEEKLFVQPMPQVRRGRLASFTRWVLEAPAIRFDPLGPPGRDLEPEYYDPSEHSDYSWEFPRLRRPANAAGGRRRNRDRGRAARAAPGRGARARPALRRHHRPAAVRQRRRCRCRDDRRRQRRGGRRPDPGEMNVLFRIPTVRLSGEEGADLRRRLAAGHDRVRATGVVVSPYRYDLVLAEEGRISADQRHVVRPAELARVDTLHHAAAGAGTTFSETSYPFQSWQESSTSVLLPLQGAPRARALYLTAQRGSRWSHAMVTPESPTIISPQPPAAEAWLQTPEAMTLRPGERRTLDWFRQPLAPGLDPQLPLQRAGDVMRIAMSGFVDAAGNHGDAVTSRFADGLTTDLRMYEDDRLLVQTDLPPNGLVGVASEPARYRIEYRVVNDAPWARLSTRTRGDLDVRVVATAVRHDRDAAAADDRARCGRRAAQRAAG